MTGPDFSSSARNNDNDDNNNDSNNNNNFIQFAFGKKIMRT